MGSVTLHTTCVQARLWTVLNELMACPELEDFYLVGGTALALRLGHRESVDIDLFTGAPFEATGLLEAVREVFSPEETETSKNTLRCRIEGIKVECIAHRYPLLEPRMTLEGIRMASLKDLAAFKANAVSNRGAKKDFWDLYALLDCFSMPEIFEACKQKYAGESLWNLEKSLVYFEDADLEPDPIDRTGLHWDGIKEKLIREVYSLRNG